MNIETEHRLTKRERIILFFVCAAICFIALAVFGFGLPIFIDFMGELVQSNPNLMLGIVLLLLSLTFAGTLHRKLVYILEEQRREESSND